MPQRGGDSWIGYERSKTLGEQLVRASALTGHCLQVDSAKARSEIDHAETLLGRLLADTLYRLRQEAMLGA